MSSQPVTGRLSYSPVTLCLYRFRQPSIHIRGIITYCTRTLVHDTVHVLPAADISSFLLCRSLLYRTSFNATLSSRIFLSAVVDPGASDGEIRQSAPAGRSLRLPAAALRTTLLTLFRPCSGSYLFSFQTLAVLSPAMTLIPEQKTTPVMLPALRWRESDSSASTLQLTPFQLLATGLSRSLAEASDRRRPLPHLTPRPAPIPSALPRSRRQP